MSDTPTNADGPYERNPYEDWDHRDAAAKITATFASQAYVQPLSDGLVRVSFGETYPDELEPRYHTAIVLSARTAADLAQLMHKISMTILNPTPPPMVRMQTEPPAPAPPPQGKEHGQ